MLPNETLLQVLLFADYRTLVLAKLAGAPFLCVATKFAEELARRRKFRVTFYTKWITYEDDGTTGARRKSIRYEPGSRPSLAAACQELAEVIGPHAVVNLMFPDNTWNMLGVGVIFEAAPPLKYAEDAAFYSPNGSAMWGVFEAFMQNFTGMKSLRLFLENLGFRQFTWTFLRDECARELRLIKFTRPWQVNAIMARDVEEFVRRCIALPRLQGGEPLELDFSETFFSGTFGQQIIKLLKGTGRELTFRMKTEREGDLVLDESEYTVDVDATYTRYASDSSGIVVEVRGHYVIIQSTAEVPRKKPRTTEEVLPVIPLVE